MKPLATSCRHGLRKRAALRRVLGAARSSPRAVRLLACATMLRRRVVRQAAPHAVAPGAAPSAVTPGAQWQTHNHLHLHLFSASASPRAAALQRALRDKTRAPLLPRDAQARRAGEAAPAHRSAKHASPGVAPTAPRMTGAGGVAVPPVPPSRADARPASQRAPALRALRAPGTTPAMRRPDRTAPTHPSVGESVHVAQPAPLILTARRRVSRAEPGASIDAVPARPAPRADLVWRKPVAATEAAAAADAPHSAATPTAPTAPPTFAVVAPQATSPAAALTLDPALVDRLADEVLRRVERQTRIARERRGL